MLNSNSIPFRWIFFLPCHAAHAHRRTSCYYARFHYCRSLATTPYHFFAFIVQIEESVQSTQARIVSSTSSIFRFHFLNAAPIWTIFFGGVPVYSNTKLYDRVFFARSCYVVFCTCIEECVRVYVAQLSLRCNINSMLWSWCIFSCSTFFL